MKVVIAFLLFLLLVCNCCCGSEQPQAKEKGNELVMEKRAVFLDGYLTGLVSYAKYGGNLDSLATVSIDLLNLLEIKDSSSVKQVMAQLQLMKFIEIQKEKK